MSKRDTNIINPLIKGQKAIHVGAVGQKGRLKRHIPLKIVCPDIIGFDISEKDVKIANEMGYDEIFVADATNMEDMDKIVKKYGTFPHVVAPNVIEHVSNLGLFIEGCKRLMSKNGKLYLSTPYVSIWKKDGKVSKGHICWFCEKTLATLLKMSGLKIIQSIVSGTVLVVIAEKI